MTDFLFMAVVAIGSGALWVIGLCRLNQLDPNESKISWLYSYKFAIGIATAMFCELLISTPKVTGEWWLIPIRALELLILAYALYRVLRNRKKWHSETGDHAPPESNRAPLGEK
jgi:hypothetical protein